MENYFVLVLTAFFFGLLHLLFRWMAVNKFTYWCGPCNNGERWKILPKTHHLIATFLLWIVAVFLVGAMYLEIKEPLYFIFYFVFIAVIFLAARTIADNLPLERLVGRYSLAGWSLLSTEAVASSSIIPVIFDTLNKPAIDYYFLISLFALVIFAIWASEYIITYSFWVQSRNIKT